MRELSKFFYLILKLVESPKIFIEVQIYDIDSQQIHIIR